MSSTGSFIRFCFGLPLKARAREIGPTRPRYIVKIIMILPIVVSEDVSPRLKPTVAVALTDSYITSIAGASVDSDKKIMDVSITTENITTTATALRIESSEMVRLNIDDCFLLRIVAKADERRTAIVIVFTPPAVPTGEPPMNIKMRDAIDAALVRFSCGTEANPAVLVVMD